MADALTITITAKDGASQVFRVVGSSARQMASDVEKAGQSGESFDGLVASIEGLDTELNRAGAAVTAFGATIIAGVGVGAKGFINLEAAMANVASIAGTTDAELAGLTDQVRGLGVELGTSPTGLAEGLYDIISSGVDAADAMMVLESSAIAARAGMTDTGTAARAVVSILNAYKMEASEAANVSDVLFQTVNSGVIRFEELANNLSQVLPIAANLNVEITELAAAYTELTLQSFSATQAETGIANILRAAINPTVALTDAVREYGYESAEALIQTEGLAGFLAFLEDQTGGSTAALQDFLGTAEGTNAVVALLSGGIEGFNARVGEMEGAMQDGATTLATYEKQAETTAFAIDRASAAWADLGVTVGATVAPVINLAADVMASWAQLLGSLPDSAQGAASAVIALSGGVSLLAGGMLLLVPRIAETISAFQALRTAVGIGTISSLGAYGAAAVAAAAIGGVLGASVAGVIDAFRDGEDASDRLSAAFSELASGDLVGFFQALRGEAQGVVTDFADVSHTLMEMFTEAERLRSTGDVESAAFVSRIGHINQEMLQLEAQVLKSEELRQRAFDATYAQGGVGFDEELARLREEYSMTAEETQIYIETLDALGQAYLDPSVNIAELQTRQEDLAFALREGLITGDEYREGLRDLAVEYGLVGEGADEARSKVQELTAVVSDGASALATLFGYTPPETAADAIDQIIGKNEEAAASAEEAAEKFRELTEEFTTGALAIGGWDNALSQLNLSGLTGELAMFAEEGIRTGQAFDNTFRILVSNVQAIGGSVQQATDWIAGMFALNDEGFSQMDTLLWENRIEWEQYDAALAAWNTTAEANYDIQQNLLAVQAMQAPYIADAVAGTQQWVAELANMDAQTQRTTLAFMDLQTVQQAQEIVALGSSEAFAAMGDSGQAAFEAVIQGALQTNPLLFDVLETMEIISGTPMDFDINWDKVAEGGNAMQQLTASVEDLVTTLREIYGLPPLDIPITVNGGDGLDTVLADVELVYQRVQNLDGTEAYMVLRADADTGALEEFGAIIDSYTSPEDPNIAYILVEADTGNFVTTIENDTGNIGDVRVPVAPEMTEDWQSIADDAFDGGEVVIPVRAEIQAGSAAVGDGTGGAQNWNDLLNVPDEVVTTITAIVEGQDEAESVSTAIEKIPESKNATVGITVTGLEDVEAAATAVEGLTDAEVTVSIVADDADAQGAAAYWAGYNGTTFAQVTVEIVADESDLTSTIASLSGAPGGGGLPGESAGPTVTVSFVADTSELDSALVQWGIGGGDGSGGMAGFEAPTIYVRFEADDSDVEATYNEWMALDGTTIATLGVTGDNSGALQSMGEAASALAGIDGTFATLYSNGDNSNALGSIGEAAGALAGIDGDTATVFVNAVNNAGSVIGSVAAQLAGLDGRSATTYVDTVYRTFGSAAGAAVPFAHGGIVDMPAFAAGGLVPFRAGEAGLEMLHFPTGGMVPLPHDGIYAAPVGSYVSPAPASVGKVGGDIHIHLTIQGNVYGMEDLTEKVLREVGPAIAQALRRQDRGMGAI